MKDIRQGNDISLQWTVNNLSQLSGDKVVQLINCDTKHAASVVFSIQGDIISGTYYGKDQHEKGEYRLILYVNRDFEGMVTLDKVGAFRLHGVCDWGIEKGSDEDSVQTVVVELESSLNVSTGGGGSFEQVQSDWQENDDTLPSFIKHKPENLSDFNNDLPTYRSIPEAWDTMHTMAELIDSINNDNTAVVGMAYLGTVHLSDLPADMVQAELIIDIVSRLGTDGDKVIVFTFSSSEVSPYRWEYTSAYGALGTWRSWLVADDITGKEDKISIETASGTTLTAQVKKYYRFSSEVNTLAVTLPIPSDTTHLQTILFGFTTGANPDISWNSTATIHKGDGYKIDANTMYEVNALYNGVNWIIFAQKIVTA